MHALRYVSRSLGIDPGQEHGELFAADPGGDVVGPAGASGKRLGEGSQDAIAAGMTVAVVVALEMIGIDHEEGDGSGLPAGLGPGPCERFLEGAPVRQAGERVRAREFRQFGLGRVAVLQIPSPRGTTARR